MPARSASIISICPESNTKPTRPVFVHLNNLVKKFILPEIDSLVKFLGAKLTAHIEEIDNNCDMQNCIDLKNLLKNSAGSIQKTFIDNLFSNTEINTVPVTNEELTLELVKNTEYEHKLIWLAATNYFEDDKNAVRISRIKAGLKEKFPEYQGSYPATPDQLCESFSIAILDLKADPKLQNNLFFWFVQHMKKAADELWACAENYLVNEKIIPLSTKQDRSVQHFTLTPLTKTNYAPPEFNAPVDYPSGDLASKLIEDQISIEAKTEKSKINRITALDLSRILSSLQSDIVEQDLAIKNLHTSVLDFLVVNGDSSKLFRHHETMINMTGWIFDYILTNENLPDDLKKVLSLLQIPILKQVIFDEKFLTNTEHPARQLLNTLTQSRRQYCNENTEHYVMELIKSTVQTIVSNHNENSDIFQDCLKEFQRNLTLILDTSDEQKETMQGVSQSNSDQIDHLTESIFEEYDEEVIVLSAEKHTAELETASGELDPSGDFSSIESSELTFTECQEDALNPQAENLLSEPVIVENLHPGQWVEFIGKGDSHRLRCKLHKLSKDKQYYIFVNSAGMRVTERTGNEIKKGIANGSVKIIEENPIFDRAIHAILNRFID